MISETRNKGATATSQSILRQKGRPLSSNQNGGWMVSEGESRLLYGGLNESGVSIEWHDFRPAKALEWLPRVHSDTLELCLNLAGNASVRCHEKLIEFKPLTAGFYLPGKNALQASRSAGQRHCFVTVQFSAGFLRQHLSPSDGALHPLVEALLSGSPERGGLGEIRRLTADQERLIAHLAHPPVFQAARGLWYQSKLLQLMVDFFFEQRGKSELFCDRQKRLARERVDGVIAILHRTLADPPSLEAIGREVACSPFHLSRTFSQETGLTIPQYLRRLRMERAAELLRSGKYNVTEAAVEVGYSSLSHFSQAFCQTMGCCPGLYPVESTNSKEQLKRPSDKDNCC